MERDDNGEWQQQDEEYQQWLADPVAQAEYKNWSDGQDRKFREVMREHTTTA